MDELELANKYWEYQKARVEHIAAKNGVGITLEDNDDQLLYDLFDHGDLELTDEEIFEELRLLQLGEI